MASPATAVPRRRLPPLLEENLLAWDIVVALYNRRAFEREQFMVAMPMGGAFMKSVPVAFRTEALVQLVEVLVPRERRREVIEQVGWVEPIAVRAAGGSDAKGSDG